MHCYCYNCRLMMTLTFFEEFPEVCIPLLCHIVSSANVNTRRAPTAAPTHDSGESTPSTYNSHTAARPQPTLIRPEPLYPSQIGLYRFVPYQHTSPLRGTYTRYRPYRMRQAFPENVNRFFVNGPTYQPNEQAPAPTSHRSPVNSLRNQSPRNNDPTRVRNAQGQASARDYGPGLYASGQGSGETSGRRSGASGTATNNEAAIAQRNLHMRIAATIRILKVFHEQYMASLAQPRPSPPGMPRGFYPYYPPPRQ